MQTRKNITVLGAGPVGSLLAILLNRWGHSVDVFDKRPAPGGRSTGTRRSINLAVSHRAWKALEEIDMSALLRERAIPMYGRMIHLPDAPLSFQSYNGQRSAIYSMSREDLNAALVEHGGRLDGVRFHFGHKFEHWAPGTGECRFSDVTTGVEVKIVNDLCIGADGVFSRFRESLGRYSGDGCEPTVYDYGYKELRIPAGDRGIWRMEPHALHIWPRGQFMFIALPNPDGSFTGTLFMPWSGKNSFQEIWNAETFETFFEANFPDLRALLPVLSNEYFRNSESRLFTVSPRCWTHAEGVLIGDAAHGILPFFGQGMNAGFEDCQVFASLLANSSGLKEALTAFERVRMPDTDAIAALSLANFTEMMEKTADPRFLLRKKIEQHIARTYPDRWTSLYSLVSFTSTPYAEARTIGVRQAEVLDGVMAIPGIEESWEDVDYSLYISHLDNALFARAEVSSVAAAAFSPAGNI